MIWPHILQRFWLSSGIAQKDSWLADGDLPFMLQDRFSCRTRLSSCRLAGFAQLDQSRRPLAQQATALIDSFLKLQGLHPQAGFLEGMWINDRNSNFRQRSTVHPETRLFQNTLSGPASMQLSDSRQLNLHLQAAKATDATWPLRLPKRLEHGLQCIQSQHPKHKKM